MPLAARFRALQPLPGVALAALTAFLGYAVRYGLVEPDRFGAACERTNPWWCLPRRLFIVFTEWNGFGWLSLALAAWAAISLFRDRDPLAPALLALGFGGAGLLLYNATFSTVAVVAGVLVLAQHRPQAP